MFGQDNVEQHLADHLGGNASAALVNERSQSGLRRIFKTRNLETTASRLQLHCQGKTLIDACFVFAASFLLRCWRS